MLGLKRIVEGGGVINEALDDPKPVKRSLKSLRGKGRGRYTSCGHLLRRVLGVFCFVFGLCTVHSVFKRISYTHTFSH